MKKEMTDLVVIPFAGSRPTGGGQAAHDVPNSGLMVGGSGGGSNPQNGLIATNTGTNSGAQEYIGYFRLVAFEENQTAPAFNFDGSVSNTTLQLGTKMSDWRKYHVICEPKQSTVALDSPSGIQNAPQTGAVNPDDGNAFPERSLRWIPHLTRRIPISRRLRPMRRNRLPTSFAQMRKKSARRRLSVNASASCRPRSAARP